MHSKFNFQLLWWLSSYSRGFSALAWRLLGHPLISVILPAHHWFWLQLSEGGPLIGSDLSILQTLETLIRALKSYWKPWSPTQLLTKAANRGQGDMRDQIRNTDLAAAQSCSLLAKAGHRVYTPSHVSLVSAIYTNLQFSIQDLPVRWLTLMIDS